MGLLEKRAAKAFQEGSYKKFTDEINSLAGYTIEFEVNWDSLAVEEYTEMYEEFFSEVYFIPVVNAVKEIVADDMGKAALKETLKKIVIKNEGEIYSASSAYSFANGILTIDHLPYNNVNNTVERTTVLTELLMKSL